MCFELSFFVHVCGRRDIRPCKFDSAAFERIAMHSYCLFTRSDR